MTSEILLADGFEDAFLGYVQAGTAAVVYDYDKAVEVLKQRDGMEHDEAVEYLEFNCLGAYLGPHTPLWVRVLPLNEFLLECDVGVHDE